VIVDSGWISSGFSAELLSRVVENLDINCLTIPPIRIALPDAPAPTANILEKEYYTSVEDIVINVRKLF
jgi:pyruvate dehydrogenase E1 component beta subunit